MLPEMRIPANKWGRRLQMAGMVTKVGGQTGVAILRNLVRDHSIDLKGAALTPQNIRHVVNSLKHLRGAAMKFGQLVSIDESIVLSPELSSILSQVRASGYSMPKQDLKTILTKAWGDGWHRKFKQFNVHPFAAASIGQVHRAVLKDGTEVAIKIQFPNIKETIDHDVNTLVAILKSTRLLPKELDIDMYARLCAEQLSQETDYLREAENLRRGAAYFKGHRVNVPKVFDAYSSGTILTMSFESGAGLGDLTDLTKAEQNSIAIRLTQLFLSELFDHRFMQTDPNLSNFLIDPKTCDLTLIDFGACCEISDDTFEIYDTLRKAILTLDADVIKTVFVQLGLLPEHLSTATQALVDDIMTTLMSELGSEDGFDFATTRLFDLIDFNQILTFADIVPTRALPADFIFVQRKFFGLLMYFKTLEANIPILPMLRAIGEMDVSAQNNRVSS